MTSVLVLVLLILSGLSVLYMPTLAAVFPNINCGSLDSDSFTDENNITWVGDARYIKSGERQNVTTSDNTAAFPPFTTRRVVPTGQKNCYSIDVGKGEHVLLRTHFYSGNSTTDLSCKSAFDLQFNGNHWVTVDTCGGKPFDHQVIYHTKFDAISVCLAQTDPHRPPFISAIQVISLDDGMYSGVDRNHPLFTLRRRNYGGDKNVRYAKQSQRYLSNSFIYFLQIVS
uniref:Malectin-like domain-containing protein n=1 Tax=Nelumbo nucifera TaxID=4432 RepID=A0A822ZSC5_NELNU|nr:TPA_asm: hypothetical protein HUJ06_004535 [Nelumbo nucifera]